MEDTLKKFSIALLAVVAVLLLSNVLITKLAEMTIERATEVGVLENKINDANESLAETIETAELLRVQLENLQQDTKEQVERNKDIKRTIDDLAKSLTDVSDDESKIRLETIRTLINELNGSSSTEILMSLKDQMSSVIESLAVVRDLNSKPKWPHAINCGNQWTTLLVQHAVPNPTDKASLAWYQQVYSPSRRFVRFNANQTYHDFGGDNEATIAGCVGKSISQLREEGRVFSFVIE